MQKDSTSALLDLFAALLEYPAPNFDEQAQQCAAQLQALHPEAAPKMERFVGALAQLSLRRMQELFTTTFDMQPVCYPYVGFHLFGESYKRGAFMAQLNEGYRGAEYSAEQELPDHISVILRFLGLDEENRQSDFSQALIHTGVLPALEKMLKTFGEESENPYFHLLSAFHLFLVGSFEKELTHV